MTVHLPLAFHSGVFGGARLSSLVGRDERRAPLKTPEWEANLPLDSVKFCVMFKDFVWATWGSDMKIVIEFPRKVFYSSKNREILRPNLKKLPSTIYLDCSQSSIFFVRSLRYTASYRHRYLDFQITEGSGVGDYSSGGEGGPDK